MEAGWVRVMADYASDGLWSRDGVMMSREDLPVTSGLRERHKAWCGRYEDSEFFVGPEQRTVAFDVDAFSAEGLEIARAVKAELPDWTVVYHDEAASQRAGLDGPRSVFEYAG